jgi:aspartyl-tRNA(Asn)/glutamyl-tRNA(Gln) amidotransferase subunit C
MRSGSLLFCAPASRPKTVLGPDDIHRLSRLARLEVTAAEIADVSAKLSSIVAMVDQLQAVDTSGVSPMAHPLDRAQRLRPDVVTEVDHHELYQRNAALVERDLYLVPKVIE